jgi:hypothetical protein
MHSPQAVAEIAHQSGWDIATARTAERLDDVTQPLVSLLTQEERDAPDSVARRWGRTFDDPEFMIGLAREGAVYLGTRVLLLTDYDRSASDDHVHPCVGPLQAFMAGLRRGGMGKATPRALIGRTIADEAVARINRSVGKAYENGLGLLKIGGELDVFGWRDSLFVHAALASHRRNHRISPRLVRWALSGMGNSENPSPA